MRIVVESPLGAPTAEKRREHLRFALWCCRAVQEAGHDPICSHVVKPWWLDDAVLVERSLGIGSEWFWLGDPHWLFVDLGVSSGMAHADDRCGVENIPTECHRLAEFAPDCWSAFVRGDWPPHTAGFEVAQ